MKAGMRVGSSGAWVVLVGCAAAMGCTARVGGGDVGATRAAISGGTLDPGDDAIVYVADVVQQAACTGTLIAPRLVLTAKHCVNDGTDAPEPPSALRVYVGPSRSQPTAVYYVGEVRVAPGPWNVGSGDDLAALILAQTSPITPMEVSFDSPSQLVGGTVTAVGYGETPSGSLGVKMEVQATVTGVDASFIHVAPSICPGDSGGPAIGPDGRVWGVASYIESSGTGSCGFPGAYTAVAPLKSFVMPALAASQACDVQPETCNGLDDNCNGVVDEGCMPLGSPCTADGECVGGMCADTAQGKRCSEPCDPMQPDIGCPPGLYCAMSGACDGWCVSGVVSATPKLLGDPCGDDTECVSLFCHDPGDGQHRCLQPCRADGGLCYASEACSASAGCGGCLQASDVPAPRGIGEPCGGDTDCRSGACLHERGLDYCTQVCIGDADCASGFHCRLAQDVGQDVCIRGPRQEVGGACVTSGDCTTGGACASSARVSWCTQVCDSGGCPDGFTCGTSTQPRVCEPVLALVGEPCGANADCTTGLCAFTATGSMCTRECGPLQQCAPGLECVRIDARGTAVCLPPPTSSHGGCSIGGGPSGSGQGTRGLGGLLVWVLAMLALVRRRRVGLFAAALGAVIAVAGSGCSNLGQFKTGSNAIYEGPVVGVDSDDAGVSFIRRGFAQGTTMTLEFDPDRADTPQAGRITTGDAASSCGGPTFDGTWLRAIAPLQHDALSLYSFPGTSRIQSYIFAARPSSGPLAGRDTSVYLSLLRGGNIEVRVISGFGSASCGPCDCYFGVFNLTKKSTP